MAAASLGLAGLSGCGLKPPQETIVPYVRAPAELVPGNPLYFATTMTLGGDAVGLLVESHEGRPTKIEGNQSHPASLGAADAMAQASVLSLYDPDRSQTVLYRGQIRSWDNALDAIRAGMAAQREKQGEGLRLLTETVTSPTLGFQIAALLKQFPKAKWHQYEPTARDTAYRGNRLWLELALDEPDPPFAIHYRFDQAERILSLDADFLASGPGHVRYARDFAARRRVSPSRAGVSPAVSHTGETPALLATSGAGVSPAVTNAGETPALLASSGAGVSPASPNAGETPVPLASTPAPLPMSRLYMVQSTPTLTGAKADHLWPLRPSRVEAFARAIAARLDPKFKPPAPADFSEIPADVLDAVAADLAAHKGSSLVVAGDEQSPAVHALAHAMNHSLSNVGSTVIYTFPVEARPEDQLASLGQLVEDMDGGRVEMLVILGGNPVYNCAGQSPLR